MSGSPFFDTNIFLDGVDLSDPHKLKIADHLIDEALLSEKGVVSYQVVQEFVSVAIKKFKPPMTEIELRTYITTVFLRFEMIGSSLKLIEDALDLRSLLQT